VADGDSFGLPIRSYINWDFLTLALAAGLDSAILDPLDREMKAALVAAKFERRTSCQKNLSTPSLT
jgi:cobalamin-dependent methionine synthase I